MFIGRIANPIADARLEAGMSLNTLANRLSLSKQYINRAEHGTYNSLNTPLVKFTAKQLGTSNKGVIEKYTAFQEATRKLSAENIAPSMLSRKNSTLPGNEIFTLWREGYWPSITAFSNSFCLHPELVRAYEEGIREEMPTLMRTVLASFKLMDPNWTEVKIGNPVHEAAKTIAKVNQIKNNARMAYEIHNKGIVAHSKYGQYIALTPDEVRRQNDL